MSDAKQMRLTAHEETQFYLKSTGREVEFLFVLAWRAYFNVLLDPQQIRDDVKRYEQTDDPPPYVRWFLRRTIQ